MPKRDLRRLMLERRNSLAPSECLAAGRRAQQHGLALAEFAAARTVALYAPIRNEVATGMLHDAALAAGKRVVFPAMVADLLVFRVVRVPEDLVCSRFGICEPLPGCPVIAPEEIDLFFIPGVAFDSAGLRVGYGKGFYDKTLHRLEGQGRLVGLCYDFQLVEPISGAPHDVQMDMVVTDQRVIHPRGHFT